MVSTCPIIVPAWESQDACAVIRCAHPCHPPHQHLHICNSSIKKPMGNKSELEKQVLLKPCGVIIVHTVLHVLVTTVDREIFVLKIFCL